MPQTDAPKSTIGYRLITATMLALFGFATLALVAPAQATPTIAKGKPCKTCHSSSHPGKSDLKK